MQIVEDEWQIQVLLFGISQIFFFPNIFHPLVQSMDTQIHKTDCVFFIPNTCKVLLALKRVG